MNYSSSLWYVHAFGSRPFSGLSSLTNSLTVGSRSIPFHRSPTELNIKVYNGHFHLGEAVHMIEPQVRELAIYNNHKRL